jgi:hypothetical protein
MAYNVPIGNWSQYVNDEIHGQEVSDYIVGQNAGVFANGDPAYGCTKNFTSTYQCGNGPTKTVAITGDGVEAGGQTVKFDCSAENKICGGFRLTVGDDGNLVLTDSNSAIVWQSNTKGTGLALDEFKASNGKYGRNYLLAGETLKTGEFVGSPSGNCYLTMVGDQADCTQNGLQLLYTKLNCTMNSKTDGYGSDDTANGLYSMKKTDISTLGKVGYIDERNSIHEYPDDMSNLAQTYTLIGSYDSVGYDISQVSANSAETCKTSCNGNADCAGFVYYADTCYLKNSGMFPKGIRKPLANAELYLRDKTVKNDISCAKEVETGLSTQWELYPTSSKMSMDTLCELGAITQGEQYDVQTKFRDLNKATDVMSKKLNSITNEKNSLNESFSSAKKGLTKNINDYGAMRRKIIKNDKSIKNIIGMSDDTELNMTSQNIKYFLYANLAIIIAIASIRLIRN